MRLEPSWILAQSGNPRRRGGPNAWSCDRRKTIIYLWPKCLHQDLDHNVSIFHILQRHSNPRMTWRLQKHEKAGSISAIDLPRFYHRKVWASPDPTSFGRIGLGLWSLIVDVTFGIRSGCKIFCGFRSHSRNTPYYPYAANAI